MIDDVLKYFKENEVKCKKVEDDRGNFIAIFGYGKLTRPIIVEKIKDNDLSCMFFEGAIREELYKARNLMQ